MISEDVLELWRVRDGLILDLGVGRTFLEKTFGGKGVGREIGLNIPTKIILVG